VHLIVYEHDGTGNQVVVTNNQFPVTSYQLPVLRF
jgi:hypothetical protein